MKLNERLLAKFATDSMSSDQEGFLLKKGEVNKGFQKRFFVLRGNLMFYSEKAGSEPIGVIILDNCRIELCHVENSMFAFQIVFDGVGTRTYVLAAETEDSMRAWMRKLTHASHICIKSVVNDLEKRLADLKEKEGSIEAEEESSSESDSKSDNNNDQPTTSTDYHSLALPKPPSNALRRSNKSKTLPVKRNKSKQATSLNNPGFNRYSLSTPAKTTLDGAKSFDFDNYVDFSERTDFLCEDISQPGRHYSMTAFTPPSFSELKNHEQIEDQNLIDLSPPDGEPPMERRIDTIRLNERFSGSRRAKSERNRNLRSGHSGLKRDLGGSLYSQKKHPSDNVDSVEENRESTFQHLHRLWGATIWVKVREYELQHSQPEAENSS
ncbi:sesquipedalian-1-like [Dendronephthya gigantea]|uniref:sesquipedalian-1-like n=1 Tax=Dendronephthya gigantea TaxID=151771 RepID=UPI00106D6F42|nr:sesquipedalian-1-like [Dendronephthya gigantea]